MSKPTPLPVSKAPRLAVGRIVLYVLDETDDLRGQIRPAIVTRVWDEDMAQLTVFPDGSNDFPAPRPVAPALPPGTVVVGQAQAQPPEFLLSFAVSSASRDQETKAPRTFHFPELD